MKLAIVTACPNGMVTSVLCARLLDAAAQRQGWSTSVEVVDVQHPERQLSAATIEAAEWVLLVSSTPVDMQRFVGKRVFRSTPAQALQDVDAVLRRGAEEAHKAGGGGSTHQKCAAYRGDHGVPYRRCPYLHGRRGVAANRQAPRV